MTTNTSRLDIVTRMSRISVLAIDQSNLNGGVYWAILVAPRKQIRVLNLSAKAFTLDFSDGASRLMTHPDGLNAPALVSIHIADIKQSLLPRLRRLLCQQSSSKSQDAWLSSSLVTLQNANLIPRISIDKFLRLGEDAVHTHRSSNREDVTYIDYPMLSQSNAQVKQMFRRYEEPEIELQRRKSFLGFWVSHPRNPHDSVRNGNGSQWQNDPYGGLM